MTTGYQRKYIDLLKCYHQIHAVLSRYTMELQHSNCLGDIQIHLKKSANKIEEIDLEVRDIVRGSK